MCIHIYIYIYICIYTYIYIYTYSHIYIYINNIYVYTHIVYIQGLNSLLHKTPSSNHRKSCIHVCSHLHCVYYYVVQDTYTVCIIYVVGEKDRGHAWARARGCVSIDATHPADYFMQTYMIVMLCLQIKLTMLGSASLSKPVYSTQHCYTQKIATHTRLHRLQHCID